MKINSIGSWVVSAARFGCLLVALSACSADEGTRPLLADDDPEAQPDGSVQAAEAGVDGGASKAADASLPTTKDPGSLAAESNTHNHMGELGSTDNGAQSPEEKRAEELAIGTPDVVARLHGCTKLSVLQIRSLLASRGVNMASTAPGSAGKIFADGQASLGAPNYGARLPEANFASTASAAKLFDIFVAAAPEIETNLASSSGCGGVTLFADGAFTKDGVSCIIAKPASDVHVNLANQAIAEATSPAVGRRLGIAALLAAAHTCE
jgi:hypothetical protein